MPCPISRRASAQPCTQQQQLPLQFQSEDSMRCLTCACHRVTAAQPGQHGGSTADPAAIAGHARGHGMPMQWPRTLLSFRAGSAGGCLRCLKASICPSLHVERYSLVLIAWVDPFCLYRAEILKTAQLVICQVLGRLSRYAQGWYSVCWMSMIGISVGRVHTFMMGAIRGKTPW